MWYNAGEESFKKERAMNMKSPLRAWRNRTTIRAQLTLVVGVVVTLLILPLMLYFYAAQVEANRTYAASALGRVMELEARQLERYVSQLRDFSLQLRNDPGFMARLSGTGELGYAGQQSVSNAFRTLFYSRRDIVWMELYLLKPRARFHIDNTRRKVTTPEYADPMAAEGPPDYLSLEADGEGFVRITRTIIDSPRTTPLAVIRFLVDDSQIRALTARHIENDEHFYLFDESGASLIPDPSAPAVYEAVGRGAGEAVLDGQRCLLVAYPGADGMILAAAKPLSAINAALNRVRNIIAAAGGITLVLGILVISGFIRLLTRPLSALAERLQGVGSGNFRQRTELEGSYEMIGLSEEANRMIENISGLIDRTYVASLNERTAQLAALEAQTNPHFLFNTLQAIATEAIMAGDRQVYRMITTLASLLRYTIRGGNLAPLDTELEYTEKYLALQKSRFGENLVYDIEADEALTRAEVPKLGLLGLVENSIVHGMRGEVSHIRLEIRCRVQEADAVISVRDDGAGIPPERLTEVRAMLEGDAVVLMQNIGLGNLASRLRLLYGDRARLEIESAAGNTVVRMRIPMEVLERCEGC